MDTTVRQTSRRDPDRARQTRRGDAGTSVALATESGERLGALLVTLGVVAQRDVAEALRRSSTLPLVDGRLPGVPDPRGARQPAFLRETRALPLREDDAEVALAMADPTDATIGAFEMVTGRAVRPMVAIPTELEAALERLYGTGKSAQSQVIGDVERASTNSRSTPTSSS